MHRPTALAAQAIQRTVQAELELALAVQPEQLGDVGTRVEAAEDRALDLLVHHGQVGDVVEHDEPQRPVIDDSYSASELIFFDDLPGQDIYQVHPIHKKFIEDCSHLWEKVIVYDSMDI